MTEYAYRAGARLQVRLPAQLVGDRLEDIRASGDGRLSPAQVVEDARPEDAPLHPLFEWDDSRAAERYRLQQARQAIAAVTVRYRQDEQAGPSTIRAFVNIGGEDRHYTSIAVAMSDTDMRAKVMRKAWDDLAAWRRRYDDIQEFAQLFATMDDLAEALPPVLAAAE